jgi:UDPglucose 6-dehydrogenase
MNYKIGIVGYGHVGGIMKELFTDAIIYDEQKEIGSKKEINECDFAFVCVPTPMAEDGHCDTSIVDNVLEWLSPKKVIIIRSTVPVGYTYKKGYLLHKRIVFQPEYYGETVAHPFADPHNRQWITLGGSIGNTAMAAELYQTVFTSELIINQVDSNTAELAKYMENSFYSTKVTFCNQFYDLAVALGVDYNKLRETWLLDPRISRSHTFVYPDNRGYGGSCLPKDTSAIIYQADKVGVDMSVLKAVEETNKRYHE